MRSFFSALAFLTVLPIPDSWKSRKPGAMFAGYPPAGLVVGVLLGLVYAAADALFPIAVSAVLVVAASLFLTGAIHLDGLADCADAFYGRRKREATLAILKDPRIGTMGGLAIGLSLLGRYAGIVSLPLSLILVALPVLSMLSRTTTLAAMRLLPYVREKEGILSTTPAVVSPSAVALAALAFLMAGALLPIPTAIAVLALVPFWRLSMQRIGGCTGDVLGATIEIGEIVFLFALAATEKLGVHWGVAYPLLRLFWGAA
jgi:adenosylcobinamide-GDP ribazoletransferase